MQGASFDTSALYASSKDALCRELPQANGSFGAADGVSNGAWVVNSLPTSFLPRYLLTYLPTVGIGTRLYYSRV